MPEEIEESTGCQSVVWWKKMEIVTAIVVGLIVIVLWIFTPFLLHNYFEDWAKSGQFGDLFGSVNALFSGLAFVALIYTIHLQRQELSLQRTELKLQREEMAASRGELAAQVAVQKLQLRATIFQIRVEAEKARIQAWSSEFERQRNVWLTDNLSNINKAAAKIEEMAGELEKENI